MTPLDFIWGSRGRKMITAIAGGIAAIMGAVTATNSAWPILEPSVPVLRYHMRDYVLEKVGGVQTTTNELLLWKFEDGKAKLRADAEGWTIQLQKEQDPRTRALIEQRVQQLQVEQRQIDERIQKLRGQ